MNSRVRMGAAPDEWPVTLRSGDSRARVRPWWHDPSIAQLTFVEHGLVPSSPTVRVWLGELRARGFASVRTGAVTDSGADLLRRQGFETLQELALLDLSLIGWHIDGRARTRTRRLRASEREAATAVDRAAFGDPWAIDAQGIDETCQATPVHRARAVDGGRYGLAGLAGYAVTGRADHTGYLQRLAVDPAAQGQGIGFTLTRDSLRWMQRRGLTRAVVNTHRDNVVALELYRRVGFRVLPHGLAVLTRRLDDV